MKKPSVNSVILIVFFFTAFLTACAPVVELSAEQSVNRTVSPDQFLVGDVYRVEKHQIIRGNIAGIGTTLIIEEGALVDGNISLIGSQLILEGRVTQDINLVAGSSQIRSSALVLGDINRILQTSKIDPNADVFGEINDFRVPATLVESITGGLNNFQTWSQPNNWILAQTALAFFIVILSILAGVVFTPTTLRTSRTLRTQPIICWLAGSVVHIFGFSLAMILILTLCLSLIGLFLLILILIGSLYGLGVLAYTLGNILLNKLLPGTSRFLIALIGGLVLSICLSLIGLIPCLGALINLSFFSMAFGSVIISFNSLIKNT